MLISTKYLSGPGIAVNVEYAKDNPGISRIKGMRMALLPIWGSFVVLFPIVGACFIISGFKKGINGVRLLRTGKLAKGVLKEKKSTNMRINDSPVYKLSFEFTAQGERKYTAVSETHIPYVLEDEPEEALLYDSKNPSYSVMFDSLPGSVNIDSGGNIRAFNLIGGLVVLIVPTLTVVGHGLYLYLRFFK